MRFVAKLVTPRPQSARDMVQAVLARETHGAMDLVRDLRSFARSLTDARFGDGRQQRMGMVL